MKGPATFGFLGVEHTLVSPADWNRADWPKLWLYNAHYFDDLAASDAHERTPWHEALIARWIAENAPGRGNGWEPYPASLRIVNWVKWTLAGHAPGEAAVHSLAMQARFLRRRLEFHLPGNHLWANLKALLFAGAFFGGEEADSWREVGARKLRRELEEQILPDGGHFERSPMYHAILLEDAVDLVQLASVYQGVFDEADVSRWRETAEAMLHWLRVMSHPDGEISFFNDSAFGVAPNVAALEVYAREQGLAISKGQLADIEALPDSGYVRLQAGPAVLIADVAPVGPDHLPGHAHADTLSFEMSLRGQRVLVNGGTSTYETGAERQRDRGTAMHNTVMVDGVDSSEVWGSFRVARRARPFDVRWGRDDGALWIEAAHDGYRRLPGRVVHRRRWELTAGRLRVIDTVTGRLRHAVASFRFAPDLAADQTGGESGTANGAGLALRWGSRGSSDAAVTPGICHRRFGRSDPCHVVVLPFAGPTLETDFLWN